MALSRKRELFYIITLVVSLLTNVGMFLMQPPAPEQISYYTNNKPIEADINKLQAQGNILNSEKKEEEKPQVSPSPFPTTQPISKNSVKITPNEPKININTADISQLVRLPGIGEATAKNIIEYRTKRKFLIIKDIMLVKGIGEKKFEKIKDFITV